MGLFNVWQNPSGIVPTGSVVLNPVSFEEMH
jgi:hypothetical protein